MCYECKWDNYLFEIEEMMCDDRYLFAEDTLYGIFNWVKEKEHITPGQIRAIENIKNSVKE